MHKDGRGRRNCICLVNFFWVAAREGYLPFPANQPVGGCIIESSNSQLPLKNLYHGAFKIKVQKWLSQNPWGSILFFLPAWLLAFAFFPSLPFLSSQPQRLHRFLLSKFSSKKKMQLCCYCVELMMKPRKKKKKVIVALLQPKTEGCAILPVGLR